MKHCLIGIILIAASLALLLSCAGIGMTHGPQHTLPVTGKSDKLTPEAVSVIARKNAAAGSPGGRVLKAALQMVDAEVVVIGSCFDYVNKVYEKALYPASKRVRVYMEAETGPYVDPALIRPGDWIMYKNLPYGEIGHSAIFVEWIDFDRQSALTIEYVGANRAVPGRFREADITKTYGLVRAGE